MNQARVVATALWVLAGGIAVAVLLGPLGLGTIQFRVSESAEQQLVGGEIALLALALPCAIASGWLWWRESPLAPALAFAVGANAVYLYTQYIVGPEYGRYPGNNQRAFPLYVTLVILGGGIVIRAWIVLGAAHPSAPPRRLRIASGIVLIATGTLFALTWVSSIVPVLRGDLPTGYVSDPQLFWLVRFMDLGAVIPLAVVIGVAALRNQPWSRHATIAATGSLAILIAAIAGMALRLIATGDPEASTPFALITIALAASYLALFGILLTTLTPARHPRHGSDASLVHQQRAGSARNL